MNTSEQIARHMALMRCYMEEAREAIAWTARYFPTLSVHGWGVEPPSKPAPHHVATALTFLDLSGVERCTRPDAVERCSRPDAVDSYGWKHRAEEWGAALGLDSYISNGEFIIAALWRGVATTQKAGTPNSACVLHLPPDAVWHKRDRLHMLPRGRRGKSRALGRNTRN